VAAGARSSRTSLNRARRHAAHTPPPHHRDASDPDRHGTEQTAPDRSKIGSTSRKMPPDFEPGDPCHDTEIPSAKRPGKKQVLRDEPAMLPAVPREFAGLHAPNMIRRPIPDSVRRQPATSPPITRIRQDTRTTLTLSNVDNVRQKVRPFRSGDTTRRAEPRTSRGRNVNAESTSKPKPVVSSHSCRPKVRHKRARDFAARLESDLFQIWQVPETPAT
jgi:hypothetical protein